MFGYKKKIESLERQVQKYCSRVHDLEAAFKAMQDDMNRLYDDLKRISCNHADLKFKKHGLWVYSQCQICREIVNYYGTEEKMKKAQAEYLRQKACDIENSIK